MQNSKTVPIAWSFNEFLDVEMGVEHVPNLCTPLLPIWQIVSYIVIYVHCLEVKLLGTVFHFLVLGWQKACWKSVNAINVRDQTDQNYLHVYYSGMTFILYLIGLQKT